MPDGYITMTMSLAEKTAEIERLKELSVSMPAATPEQRDYLERMIDADQPSDFQEKGKQP